MSIGWGLTPTRRWTGRRPSTGCRRAREGELERDWDFLLLLPLQQTVQECPSDSPALGFLPDAHGADVAEGPVVDDRRRTYGLLVDGGHEATIRVSALRDTDRVAEGRGSPEGRLSDLLFYISFPNAAASAFSSPIMLSASTFSTGFVS